MRSASIRILHLEDDDHDARLIHAQLTRAGLHCEIHRVGSGQTFEEALSRDCYDLILVDYTLPGYDGRRAVLESRERRGDVPVIVVSGMIGEEAAVECLHLGAVDYVLKQRPARLAAAVERALKEADERRRNAHADSLIREATNMRLRAAELFRLAIEAAPAGMILTNREGRMTLVNAEAERLFGYLRKEMLNQPVAILIPSRFRDLHGPLHDGFYLKRQARAMAAGRNLFGLRKDGSEVPIEIGLNPLETPEGELVLCSVVDITDRQRSEARLRTLNAELEQRVTERTSQLREREALLQEIHHRVKNNLQVVTSLINMQMRNLEDATSRVALSECQSRVQAMARIHELLYRAKDHSRVPFADYLRKLATQVVSLGGLVPDSIDLRLDLQDLSLPVQSAIPCGLIVNELLSNSLKHAFPEGLRGEIRIEFHQVDNAEIELSVSDNGIGFQSQAGVDRLKSFGVQLVETLVEQLEGTMHIAGSPGTRVRVRFPADASTVRHPDKT